MSDVPSTPQDRSLPPRLPALAARADRALVRAGGRSSRHALVTVTAPVAPASERRLPVSLALVLDRSGSMAGEKIALARRAVEEALARLDEQDRFSLVVYDDRVDVLAPSTRATAAARRAALARLAEVDARGSTDLTGGWMRGCEQVAAAMAAGGSAADREVRRCLLLTDGLANHGLTDPDAIVARAGAMRGLGVATSTFGVGADFDERLLAGMADAGGGHFYFLASAREIPVLVASEVGEALEVVVPRASLEVRLAPGAAAEPLTRFAATLARGLPDGGGDVLRVGLGDLVSAQEVEVVLALRFPRGVVGEAIAVEVGLLDADGLPCAPSTGLRWTYASHGENDRQPRDGDVDRAVAALYAARAREAAVDHSRVGRHDRARHALVETARRIRGYAGSDAALHALADALVREAEEHATGSLGAMELKSRQFQAYAASASRGEEGRARRRPS